MKGFRKVLPGLSLHFTSADVSFLKHGTHKRKASVMTALCAGLVLESRFLSFCCDLTFGFYTHTHMQYTTLHY